MLVAAIVLASATFPPFTGPVVDAADVVPAVVEQRVDASLLDYQQRTGVQIAVAVVSSTAPEGADAYAADLAGAWGVIANGLQRGVVLVIDVHAHAVGLAVAPAVAVTFTPTLQRRFVTTEVLPRVAHDDVGDAVELGAQELRRALNDPAVPPPVTTKVVPVVPRRSHAHRGPWAGIVLAIVALALVVVVGFAVRRRRAWGTGAPILWGSGWGRPVGRPLAVLDRRYRRVRDAVHVAEAETGLHLCFWLGPVEGPSEPVADELFAHAVVEGHAAVLVLVATATPPLAVVRMTEWAAARVPGDLTTGVVDDPPHEVLVGVARRIAAAAGAGAPTAGGVARPDLY